MRNIELKIYGKAQGSRRMEPRITFNGSGAIKLNKAAAVELVNVKEGEYLAVAQDKRNPKDWYLLKGPNKDWCKPRFQKNGDVIFNNSNIVTNLFQSLNETRKSQSYFMEVNPTKIGSDRIYSIFTLKPLLS